MIQTSLYKDENKFEKFITTVLSMLPRTPKKLNKRLSTAAAEIYTMSTGETW
jgi:hypothetical protein